MIFKIKILKSKFDRKFSLTGKKKKNFNPVIIRIIERIKSTWMVEMKADNSAALLAVKWVVKWVDMSVDRMAVPLVNCMKQNKKDQLWSKLHHGSARARKLLDTKMVLMMVDLKVDMTAEKKASLKVDMMVAK